MYIKRAMESKFLKLSNFFKAVLVTGARQVGKTTMLKHLMDDSRTYVTLDDAQTLELAKSDPKLFFMRYKPPILIDEVQYAPELFPYIKIICDQSEEKGLFWLTGSEQYKMMSYVGESLAGRIGIMTLHPLSFNEINGVTFEQPIDFTLDNLLSREKSAKKFDVNTVFAYIWKGGMPDMQAADTEERSAYFSSYIDTYLMRDVRNAAGITDELKFKRFLTACAANVAQQVNYETLAQAADISAPTAKTWLSVLERLHIVLLLQPYANNKLKRLSKTPKLYFWDTGLCSYLARWLTLETLLDGRDNGHYFENFAICELAKDMHYSSLDYELSYYRDSNAKEVDLFIESSAGQIYPLEIKMSSNPDKREVKKYDMLSKNSIPRGNGGIICMSPTVLPIDEQNNIIPISIL